MTNDQALPLPLPLPFRESHGLPRYDAYRSSSREPEPPVIPSPSWRTLLGPFGRASLFVVIVLAPAILFNLIAPSAFHLSRDVRLVPWIDSVLEAFAITALASFAVLIGLIVRRVRPSWRAFSLLQKVLYVGALLNAQAIVVATGEGALLMSRGFDLFAPELRASTTSPDDGRTAYLYEGCFIFCTREVFIAEPHALTMTRVPEVPVRTTDDDSTATTTKLHVEWLEDRTVRIVDRKRPEARPFLFFGGGGC